MHQPSSTPTPPRSELSRLFLRWLIYSLAIFAAVWIVPGIEFSGPGWQIGIVALLFGLLNVLLRPLILLMTCPLMLLTLGLFGLVINALLLGLTSALADQLGIDFVVYGFWPAFFGGMVISLVSTTLQYLAGDVQFRIVVERRQQ
ncbi:phage holin family protein [Chloroflexus sp.]|uniref:phage holin family protein n=1 Tax=Chloroflexus sp. TaxID=1904827 RepID=UPI00261872AB|nr:phage holin family protein [uncultured Chloroflexus sp.]